MSRCLTFLYTFPIIQVQVNQNMESSSPTAAAVDTRDGPTLFHAMVAPFSAALERAEHEIAVMRTY